MATSVSAGKEHKRKQQLFLAYKTLESEVESYPVTLVTVKREFKTPPEFINYIDFEMDRLGNIALGFDISEVSYEGAFETGKRSSATPTPTETTTQTKTSDGRK